MSRVKLSDAVGKYAYESRKAKGQDRLPEPDPELYRPDDKEITMDGQAYLLCVERWDNTWTANVYLDGELFFEGDRLFYDPDEAQHEIELDFIFWSSDRMTA